MDNDNKKREECNHCFCWAGWGKGPSLEIKCCKCSMSLHNYNQDKR